MIHKAVRVNGATVSWSLSPTNRERLRVVYERHGVEALLPPETTDRAALKGAMEDLKGKDQLVQSLKSPSKNGYEVVNVTKGTHSNRYDNNFSAWFRDGVIDTGYGFTDTARLRERFEYRKGLLAPSAVSKSLAGIVASIMGAVTLYPGTYWIPQESLPAWEALAKDVEQLGEGQNRLRQLTTVMDCHTMREVRDAIAKEIDTTVARIAEELAGGELGDEALESRRDQALKLHKRIEEYEDVLDETLDRLHESVKAVEEAATLATLQTV